MAENVLSSGNELMDSIRLKVKSLTALLSEIKQPSNNYEFDPSICNDIYAYINTVQTDCQKLVNDNQFDSFSNEDRATQQTDDSNVPEPIRRVYVNDHYDDEMRQFEDEIDLQIDEVIRSIETNADVLNTHYEEKSLLDEQINIVYSKLHLHKNILNDEIDEFNNADIQMVNEFHEWKERLKQNNDANIVLIDEIQRLIHEYQQNTAMIKNNVMNSIESAAKSFALRAECLKLEIRIVWEGKTILKMYKNIDKLVEVNRRKLDRYDDLQFQTGNINSAIDKDLDYMTRANAKLRDQIQIHSDVGQIAEDKHRQLCLLNDEIREIQELLVNDREYLNSVELATKENETEIAVKRQQIEDELIKAKHLKDELENKNKLVSDAQRLLEQKQSQLEEIESRNEKMTRELENAKLELQKKRYNAELMQRVMDHHERETREKIQYYCDSVIRPLELKLEKSIASVDCETMRNDELKTASATELGPEFQKMIDDVGSQIERLDKTLGAQYETTKQLESHLRDIQTDVVRELNVSANKSEKYMNTFQTVVDYKTQMASNAETRRTAARLECELFQRRYETTRNNEKREDEEKRLTSQLRELKQLVRQQAAYNKELSRQYVRSNKSTDDRCPQDPLPRAEERYVVRFFFRRC